MKVLLKFKLKNRDVAIVRYTRYSKVLEKFGNDLEWIEPIVKDKK